MAHTIDSYGQKQTFIPNAPTIYKMFGNIETESKLQKKISKHPTHHC